MTPIILEPGESRREQHALSLTKAGKDRILQNFPEKIAVSVPGFGPQDFPLRVFVKSLLDQVQPPAAHMTFAVDGDAEEIDELTIENTRLKVIGPSAGSFKVVDAEVAYAFDIEAEAGPTETVGCNCDDGRDGEQRARSFKFTWQIEIAIDPGISGTFEIEEFEVAIETPCVCPQLDIDDELGAEEAEDDDQDGGKRRKRKKKSKRRD